MNLVKIIRIVAALLAIIAAFVPNIPYALLALALLGLANGFLGVEVERRVTYMITALALAMSASALHMVPYAGTYLTAIFTNLSVVLNAGVLAVVVVMVKDQLTK